LSHSEEESLPNSIQVFCGIVRLNEEVEFIFILEGISEK